MPYSDNRNTISSCSQILPKKEKNVLLKDDEGASCSSGSVLDRAVPKGKNDVYVSCKAKYNNKNKTLMICKRASQNH